MRKLSLLLLASALAWAPTFLRSPVFANPCPGERSASVPSAGQNPLQGSHFLASTVGPRDFLRNWLVLGPFSNSPPGQHIAEHGTGCFGFNNDLLAGAGGETKVVPDFAHPLRSIVGEERSWQLYLSPTDWIDFDSHFSPNDDVVAYAAALLTAEQPVLVDFGLSHNDGLKLWVNGELVYSQHEARITLDSAHVPVRLRRGQNRLLVKVDEKRGGWGFAISVKSLRGRARLVQSLALLSERSRLEALLFSSLRLDDCEPLVGQPLSLRFPVTGVQLRPPMRLTLKLRNVNTSAAESLRTTLTGSKVQLAVVPKFQSEGTYRLSLVSQPNVPAKVLHVVKQKVFQADPDTTVGQRPYEMADRPGCQNPLVDFEDMRGWRIRSRAGARARLYRSRVQQMNGRYVAKVVYRGVDSASEFEFGPPQPLVLPDSADDVRLWIYGNNWAWVPDPSTPPVNVQVILLDEQNREIPVFLSKVNWKEWFLCWKHFQRDGKEMRFKSIRVTGCGNRENRLLFFDSLEFGHEAWQPLHIPPLPEVLPFLTTQETILPQPSSSVAVQARVAGKVFESTHTSGGAITTFRYEPRSGTLADFTVRTAGGTGIQPFVSGDIQFDTSAAKSRSPSTRKLESVRWDGQTAAYTWSFRKGPVQARYEIRLQAKGNSLVIDLSVPGSELATGVRLGYLHSEAPAKLVRVPFLTYGRPDPAVVCTADVFLLALLDHYRSRASALWADNAQLGPNEVRFNGRAHYFSKTDGHRNALAERIVLTVSTQFEDVLPNIPHPASPMGHLTAARLWKENWGMPPDSTAYESFYLGLKLLRDLGVSKFIVRHHEETWRDGGESFTLRLHAAPKKGGDEALRRFVKRVKALGFLCGLYTNYVDFAPVNANWSPDRVARQPNRDFVSAWPRCYTLKPALAPIFEAEYAPKIHAKYGANTVYCDVHTALTPWSRVDFDDRVPGAGMFRGQYFPYALLLLHEKRAYEGPVFSEGSYHWFYAGLTDGNYGQIADVTPTQVPPLVDFDLLRIHPLETDVGMGNPAMFYRGGIPDEERNSRSLKFDRFLATTVAYGHIGYLVDIPKVEPGTTPTVTSSWGIPAILKSYFMMQQLQSRYALKPAQTIAYFDGKRWLITSQAVRSDAYKRGQIRVHYEGGLTTVVNLDRRDTLQTRLGKREIILPPNGYAAAAPGFFELSGLAGHRRVDLVVSPEYVYADGRGVPFRGDAIAVTNSAVVFRDRGAVWVLPIDEKDGVGFRLRALGLKEPIQVVGCNQDGEKLAGKVNFAVKNGWLWLQPDEQFFKYRLETAK